MSAVVCLLIIVGYFLPIQPNALTYMFVHANVFHLMANVIAVFLFLIAGRNEKTFFVMVLGGLFASMYAYLIYNSTIVVGASGFGFGVMGVYMVFRYRGLFRLELFKSLNFASILFAIVVGMVIPSLAGLLHLYAFAIGLLFGQLALTLDRFIHNLQQYR